MPGAPLRDIAPEWKDQPRRWGHSFHPMCSYLGSSPAALVHAFVARYSRPGDVVFDPFCGRGTVPLGACAVGRIGVGNDVEPLAALLTAAKVDAPMAQEASDRISLLRIDWSRRAPEWMERAAGGDAPPEVAALFHPRTLAQLLFLRASLDPADRTDRFLLAATAGILHGRRESYLTPAMHNGFSPSARSVARALARSGAPLPERELFTRLGAKIHRLFRDGRPPARGIALRGDARSAATRAATALTRRSLPVRMRLVVSSPPYLATLRYREHNWLRRWLIGDTGERGSIPEARTPAEHAALIRATLRDMRPLLAEDAIVLLVLGDVGTQHGRASRRPLDLSAAVWRDAAEPEGFLHAGTIVDPVTRHRKLTAMWGAEAGRATDTDRLLMLAVAGAGLRRAIAGAQRPVGWTWPPRGSSLGAGPSGTVGILATDAAALPPRRSRRDGPAGPDEEP